MKKLLCAVISVSLFLEEPLARPLEITPPSDYLESPVFFEKFFQSYSDAGNLVLLPQGKVKLEPFGVMDLGDFDWQKGPSKDPAWWVKIEEFRQVLPFIASKVPEHRIVAKNWFYSWFVSRKKHAYPNPGAWDLMTTSIRGMVFVFFLKQEVRADQVDEKLVDDLKRTIFEHQQYLAREGNFHTTQNHGMWEAIALFEMSRVFPHRSLSDLALRRLLGLTTSFVSAKGIEKEHAPHYHFEFSKWLSHYVEYLESLGYSSWTGLDTLKTVSRAMLRANYYLQDHKGNVPQIGDGDVQKAPPLRPIRPRSEPDEVCFDSEAGFAIFKDRPSKGLGRYVVFNIQNSPPEFPFHIHNDVLAVYYAQDGEIILSDQGRFHYSHSGRRMYFVSPAAHNTVFPHRYLEDTESAAYALAQEVGLGRNPDEVQFSAEIFVDRTRVRRTVSMDLHTSSVVVNDSISGPSAMVLLWNIGDDVREISPFVYNHRDAPNSHQWFLVTRSGRRLLMSMSAEGPPPNGAHRVDVIKGASKPLLGWYSPAYQKLEQSTVIKFAPRPSELLLVTTRMSTLN